MRASAVGLVDEEDPRELREATAARQERTAFYTFLCCLFARLVFLVAHGLTCFAASVSFQDIESGTANWWLIFLPNWIGCAFCLVLLMLAWCASCKYIKLCLSERVVRINDNPSILTEVLPDITTTFPGLIFLALVFYSEFYLCDYLATSQAGEPSSLIPYMVFSSCVALLSICQGTLFKDNSALWISLGAGLLVSSLSFAASRGEQKSAFLQALIVLPFVLAVATLLTASIHRLKHYAAVLRKEEQTFQKIEVALLGVLFICLASVAYKVLMDKLSEAAVEGCLVGIFLCLLAFPRARLCIWEAKHGHLADRSSWSEALPL